MKKITENLPIVSLGLLIIGFIRLIMYYSFFGIDVTSYLETTEVLQLEFSFFAFAFCMLLAFALQRLESIGRNRRKEDKLKALVPTQEALVAAESTVVKEIKLSWIERNPASILLGVSAFVMACFVAHDRLVLHKLNTFHFELLIYFSALLYLTPKITNVLAAVSSEEKGINVNAFLGMVFIVVMAAVVIDVRREAFKVMTEKPIQEATLVLENRTVKTDSSLIFVGKTRNYVFLYNKDKEEAEVIPADKITDSYFSEGKPNTRIPKTFQIK